MMSATGTRPNILWITTDQQRYDTVHALGNDAINTPNLDRLCREGTAFARTYCQSPICTPSRASFLTGLYPSTVHANINGNAHFPEGERFRLITQRLAETGYTCGLSGKLHIASAWNGVEERVKDGYRVFRHSQSATQGHNNSNEYHQWLEEIGKLDEVLDFSDYDEDRRLGARYRENVPAELHQTTWCADRAIEFMTSAHDSPWLMSVNIFDPHPPYDAPRDYADRYNPDDLPEVPFAESDLAHNERLSTHMFQHDAIRPGKSQKAQLASYYGMIELIDENVGRMIDALEQTGQRENTLVIFTSDHGDLLGDHGLCQKGCRFYEGAVRVPLIVSWPGQVQEGAVHECLVELNDLAPTIAEYANIDLDWTHGRSLAPLLSGKAPDFQPHDYVRCEYYDTLNMQAPHGDPALHVPSYATMYRTNRYKLNVYHGNTYGELFDMEADPQELNNLWEDAAFQELKFKMLKESFDASIVITDPGPERIGRF